MKALRTITIILSLFFITSNAEAQAGYSDEPVTAETFLRMQDGEAAPFAISPVKIENSAGAFSIKWQTINESNIASFELQVSDDKNNFTTIKKMQAGNTANPANLYQVDIKNSFIKTEKTYFRVKTTFSNAAVVYTENVLVKVNISK
ncbi:MAG: hypothetical protein QM791_04825 [Ferruginibacter sp.]